MPLVNGEERDALSVFDRGLAYGDGLFETLRMDDGAPQLLDEHLRRLAEGCARLKINADIPRIRDEALGVCARADGDNVLKIIVTRGDGGAYRAPGGASPNRIVTTAYREPWPEAYYARGIALRVCAHRLGDNPALAGLKHLNRLDQVLARAEWGDEYPEGLMLDAAGRVIEGTMTNVLFRRDGAVMTPKLDRAGVAGVMRAQVLAHLARDNLDTVEVDAEVEDLLDADGVLVCNSLIGVCPVRSIDGRAVPVRPCDREAALCGELG